MIWKVGIGVVGEVGETEEVGVVSVVDIVIGVVIGIPRSKPGAPGSPSSAVVVGNQGAGVRIEDEFPVKVEVEKAVSFGAPPHA